MTATAEETALLRAINANPACDTPRLVYADWLDETHGGVRCTECPLDEGLAPHPADIPCQRCNGTGYVPHPRAEFVRVQCELARLGRAPYPRCSTYAVNMRSDERCLRCESCQLVSRQSALLAAHEAAWRRAGPCPECGGDGAAGYNEGHGVPKCPSCSGTGDVGGLCGRRNSFGSEREYPTTWDTSVTFRRGFIDEVAAPFEQVFEQSEGDCPSCRGARQVPVYTGHGDHRIDDCWNCAAPGEWQPTAQALAWMRHPTITRVALDDREPTKFRRGLTWLGADDVQSPYHIPICVFNAGASETYPTRAEALDALAAAACRVLRGWKG